MSEHTFEAAVTGFGCYTYSGTPNNITFSAMLIAAGLVSGVPADCDGFDLCVVSSAAPLYLENDGTAAAAANSFPLEVGYHRYRRMRPQMTGDRLRFFSAGAQEVRIALWGTVSLG